jgi:phosphohistidine phosphatase SixA
MVHALSSLALLARMVFPGQAATTELRREELMEALRKGGYTVMLRHARTDRSINEQRDPVPTERSNQRNLNDEGVKDAALMGVVFRKHGIRFAEIISSPMFRCIETAEYSAGKPTSTTMALRSFPSTPEQVALVMKAPGSATNRLIVTHHFVIEQHVPGIKPGDIGESEAAVVRHTADGKVELVGRITLEDWSTLANPDGGAKPATGTPKDSRGHGGGPLAALGRIIHGSPSESGNSSVKIPDSHAGHIASEYIKAFNTGNEQKMRAFLEEWMVPSPNRSMEERLRSYKQLFADHGSLAVTAVHDAMQLEVALGVKSKVGDFRLTVKSSPEQPMRGSSVTFARPQGHP